MPQTQKPIEPRRYVPIGSCEENRFSIDGSVRVTTHENKIIITDRASANTTYQGRAEIGSSESAPVWLITRTTVVGNITKQDVAGTGLFNQVWNDRASLFPPAPFVNEYSLNFDGINDYVSMGNPANLSFERTDAFSLSCWFNTTMLGTTQGLMTKRDATANLRGYQLALTTTGEISFNLSNINATNRLLVNTTAPILPLTWYHLIVTYDGTSLPGGISIYLNGSLQGITTITSTLTSTIITAENFQVGARSGVTLPFLGFIDEPAVYDIALTLPQVVDIYNSGVPRDLISLSTGGNLVSWWRNGDSDFYPTILDQVGINHGTMINMATTNIVAVVP